MSNLSNITIKKDKVIVKINSKFYSLDIIYSAAYVFLDKAYILIDGDIKKEIIVELKPKAKRDLETLGNEFNNELLNYATYKVFSEKNKDIRTMIVQRAIITGDPKVLDNIESIMDDDSLDEETKKLLKELEEEDDDELNDPEGIAIPWEEKYGKKSRKIDKKNKNGKRKTK